MKEGHLDVFRRAHRAFEPVLQIAEWQLADLAGNLVPRQDQQVSAGATFDAQPKLETHQVEGGADVLGRHQYGRRRIDQITGDNAASSAASPNIVELFKTSISRLLSRLFDFCSAVGKLFRKQP